MKEKHEKNTVEAARIPPALVAEAKAGDQAAFTELYQRTSAMIYRTIRSMIGDEELVWDVQQDAYLRAWRSLDTLEAPEAFLPWLRRIAVNTAVNALNKRVPMSFSDLAEDEDAQTPELPDLNPDAQPELVLDRKETSRLVRELLKELPPEQQAVVGMHYYEDMPIKDIAALLHVSAGTVKTQLSRGRKRIEAGVRALEQQGVKLYGLSPLPFLLALLGRLEPAVGAEKAALTAVLAEAPAAGSAAGASAGGTAAAAAGGTTATVTAMTAGQAFLHGLGAKLLAGALAVAVLAAGGKLAYDALKKGDHPPVGPERPTITETAEPGNTEAPSELSETEPPAPVLRDPNACGEALTWTFDADTGTLRIAGSGGMYDYDDNIVIGSSTYSFSDDYPVDDKEPDTYEYLYVNTPWQRFKNEIRAVELPDGLSSVGAHAFSECSGLESIRIPDSVSSIGEHAFYGCSQLSSVQIPESVVSIGEKAFCGCSSLRSLEIPASVASIGTAAFGDCTGLDAFSVHPENACFEVDAEGVLYSRDHSVLIAFPAGKSGAYEIHAGVTAIGGGAFSGCELPSVTIPAGVTTIGDAAFFGCHFLNAVDLPAGLTAIGESAFEHCALTDLTLPASLTSIGEKAFSNCHALTELTIPGGVSVIEASSFEWCSSLTSVTISEGVTEIGDRAFLYCSALTELTIPGSLRAIGESAYSACDSLTALTIPEGVVSIGESAFSECAALRSLSLPDSLTELGKGAFAYCSELRSVALPAGLTSLGTSAFAECSALEAFSVHPDNPVYASDENGVLYDRDEKALIACPCSFKGNLEIPDGVTSIGYAAFAGCEGLRAVTIPESVSAIDVFAFSGCTGLSSVALPEGMTTVESYVFYGCTGLRSVTFPESLTTINACAFLNCSGLTRVSIPENLSFIGEGAFGSCTALEGFSVQAGNSVYSVDENGVLYSRDRATLFICPAGKTGLFEIPTHVTTVKSWSFYGCSGLSAVTIPESVTYIGACAFSGCSGLTELTVPGSVRSIGNGAFSSCVSLNAVTISEGVTAIGYEAFDSCYALSVITIPESVTSIQEGAISSFGEKTIFGVPGSEAERYAEEHMIPFETAP